MRFKNILFAAAAAMALTACSSDDAIETVQQKSQFPEDGEISLSGGVLVHPCVHGGGDKYRAGAGEKSG